MALGQRRMLHTSIWKNEDFASLSKEARLLYIATITLADDDGRLKGSSKILRADVFGLDESINSDHVRKWLNEIVKAKLITFYQADGEYYIQHPKWEKFQLLRSDRKKDSDIPPPTDNQATTKRHRSIVKYKIREEGGAPERSPSYLREIPETDLAVFHIRFDCSRLAIKNKAEDLALWCETNGRSKKNYRAFLLNALKKDFPERRKEPPRAQNEPETNEKVSDVVMSQTRDKIAVILGKRPKT